MVTKIQVMSENPLTQFTISNDDGDEQMETRMLENSISRICSLLAVGFGDAGSEIIAENMKRGGAIDPMIPGKRMTAIFGFCDIRQFTDTTEILQEDIMEFVNTIAKIVHVEVHLHGGSANKNIGDAFLLVWKFPKTVSPDDISSSASLVNEKRQEVQNVADNALASFITIIGALRRSARLHRYRGNKELNDRIANFEVRMGFGLHVGWAIEGAIGSEYKVDASYLSPNVNISARLEAATKQFGVPLLFTGEFADLLSPKVRKMCRQIDCVTVKGSLHPVKLFTFDVRVDNIDPPGKDVNLLRTFEEETMSLREYADEFEEHPDIIKLRKGVSEDFLLEFNRGLQHYIDGEWRQASEILQRTRTVMMKSGTPASDGPSESLLKVMQAYDYVAPKDWRGFRELTEK
jgi:class 3 adenylate cyclase